MNKKRDNILRGKNNVATSASRQDKFPWGDFIAGLVCVHCHTPKDWTDFLKRCARHNIVAASDFSGVFSRIIVLYNLNGVYNLGSTSKAYDAKRGHYDWAARKFFKPALSLKNTDYPVDRNWTSCEIEQAKEISRGLVLKLFDEGKNNPWVSTCVDYSGKIDGVSLTLIPTDSALAPSRHLYSKPCGKDVFNLDIGKCVCLCKVTNTPIPKFIKNKNRESLR